jgi:hypothetical protein
MDEKEMRDANNFGIKREDRKNVTACMQPGRPGASNKLDL